MSDITRRDFLNGVALSVGTAALGASGLSGAHALAAAPMDAPYPPALTGMRGAHAGSFEVAHAMSWEGKRYSPAENRVDDIYDLVIVGGGLSGLAAARYYQQAKPEARILILDNHDDFGGHAKRNEFTVSGQTLVGYGGSQSIDTPSSYSPEAMALLKDVGIEPQRFFDYYDRDFFASRDMDMKVYLNKAHYGADRLIAAPPSLFGAGALVFGDGSLGHAALEELPIGDDMAKRMKTLIKGKKGPLKGVSKKKRKARLASMSYADFLRMAGMSEDVITLMNRTYAPLTAMSWENTSALAAADYLMPGTALANPKADAMVKFLMRSHQVMPHGMWQALADKTLMEGGIEPYVFHFPDGNAGIARLLVRKMIPSVGPGSTMEDVVLSRFDYGALDKADNKVRIRLKSTVVDVRHAPGGGSVDVSYMREGKEERVIGERVILACNHKIIPYICQDMPADQKAAQDKADRAPLAYITVALTNWRAWKAAGTNYLYSPQAMFPHIRIDFPVSMGGVAFPQSPDEPVLLHIPYTPAAHLEGRGRTARDLFKEGKHWLYVMSFSDFELGVKEQLTGALGPYGFDAEKDVAAITVNRWPHGYAYYPDPFWGDPKIDDEASPQHLARQRQGRISIANSDAEYKAYVNGAFDAAWRAVEEQLTA